MGEVAALGRDYLNRFNVPPAREWEKKAMTGQTFSLDANVIIAGFSAREGCLDFYHASPHVIRALLKGGDFYAEPIVRVMLTTRLLMHIHDLLEEKKATMPFDELEEKP
jgi:hypothetical protein